jgi:hypothetical protein
MVPDSGTGGERRGQFFVSKMQDLIDCIGHAFRWHGCAAYGLTARPLDAVARPDNNNLWVTNGTADTTARGRPPGKAVY